MKLILASQSPRRNTLLKKAGFDFTVVPSSYNEKSSKSKDPFALAKENALKKAKNVAGGFSEGIVLGADTIVVFGGKILGKLKNEKEAKNMLKILSGKINKVITGIALVDAKTKKELVDYGLTNVKFKKLGEEEINKYVANINLQGESITGFTGYVIQSMDNEWIERVEGSHSNVVGLPMEKLKEMLKQFKY